MATNHRPLFTISNIANLLNIHPQTLRLYEREGFLKPYRTKGNTRMYSHQDVEQLQVILHLTRELEVNLAGVEVILHMQQQLTQLQRDTDELRQLLAECMRHTREPQTQQRALIKASSRMLIKV
ncbi:hypothetical protein NKDENANG_00811 [Candidatus Entotheonellaceae bacterium PAL068K]